MDPSEVLETLEAGIPIIAEEYGAEALADICQQLGNIECWWGTDDSDLEEEEEEEEGGEEQ
jgi:hypothetical protein